jgi:hypothetical protein
MSGNDPEETTPFTHRPYGSQDDPPPSPSEPPQNPPSWDTYQQPPAPSFPSAPYGQPAYGQPAYGQPAYGQPAYGQPNFGQVPHPEANTALIMGIVSLAGTFVCGILCVVGPFAWAKGAKVRREIDADPQRWSGRGEATAGYVMGIITTMLMILAVLVVIAAIVIIAASADTT